MAFLEVKDLEVEFQVDKKPVIPLKGISFEMNEGEVLGIVGETGSGKSLTAHAIMGLSAMSGGKVRGSVKFTGQSLLELSEKGMQSIRGSQIAFIPQNPMTSLDPVYRVGDQIMEGLLKHADLSKAKARQQVLDIMGKLNIPKAEHVFQQYPHELSGGLKQRIVIAMGLCTNPRLLIADEPTTALDVTIQAQILELMNDIKSRLGTGIILITHDLGVVAEIAQRIVVMYAGQVVEEGTTSDIFNHPKHPYTRGLLRSVPKLGERSRHGRTRLLEITGMVPSLYELPEGCSFHPRCKYAMAICRETPPEFVDLGGIHRMRCYL